MKTRFCQCGQDDSDDAEVFVNKYDKSIGKETKGVVILIIALVDSRMILFVSGVHLMFVHIEACGAGELGINIDLYKWQLARKRILCFNG